MTQPKLQIVILGLTITSSWGNGHATTYRSLIRGLARRGHRVVFLERDKPWYAAHRDLPEPPYGTTALYSDIGHLVQRWGSVIAAADLVILGSFVPDGVEVARIVQKLARGATAFYDIDTPVTLAALEAGSCEYLCPDTLDKYDLYLSFTGGPVLKELEERWGARQAVALYCAADPEIYHPEKENSIAWDLGYLGTFSRDRQSKLDELVSDSAEKWPEGRFVVAGPLYPPDLEWPANVARIEHLAPDAHRNFYAAQRFTLNVTRADMIKRGWSPSVRLFEAASCGTPIISDWWEGLDSLFRPGEEILLARDETDVLEALRSIPERRRLGIAAAARTRVLQSHTADHRATELECYAVEALERVRQRALA